jgi:omega-hydroxy-beta-dihydromenaquinone-9 sulfotransferase
VLNRPIIIFGTGRSGTTLISEIIFRHNQLAFPSNYHEKFPGYPTIGLVRTIHDNPFWRFFGEKEQNLNKVSLLNNLLFTPSEAWAMWDSITGLGDEFSRGFLLERQADETTTKKVRDYLDKLVRSQFRSRLAFKLTGPSRFEYLSSIFPDAIFLNVIRNPVPVVSSFLKAPFWQRQGMREVWWKGAYSSDELNLIDKHSENPIWMTGFQIKKILDINRSEQKKITGKYLEVKYEDFVSAPADWIKILLQGLGLESDSECFNYLNKHKIIWRNKHDTAYFNSKELDILYSIFN